MEEQSPKEPSAFKQEWEAKKLLKKSKKKAKKSLMDRGHSPKEATGMIKQALKNIQSNKPVKRAAGRGG
jgi:ribosomal protein L22